MIPCSDCCSNYHCIGGHTLGPSIKLIHNRLLLLIVFYIVQSHYVIPLYNHVLRNISGIRYKHYVFEKVIRSQVFFVVKSRLFVVNRGWSLAPRVAPCSDMSRVSAAEIINSPQTP